MAQPVTSSAAAPAIQDSTLDSYKNSAFIGAIATAVCTLINPISGAAIGTFCITDLTTSVLMDKLGWDKTGMMGKISRLFVSYLVSLGAAVGVLAALGVTITFTPPLIGAVIGSLAMLLLFKIGSD